MHYQNGEGEFRDTRLKPKYLYGGIWKCHWTWAVGAHVGRKMWFTENPEPQKQNPWTPETDIRRWLRGIGKVPFVLPCFPDIPSPQRNAQT